MTGPVTIGIDVGTTSVKAVAVDEEGRPQARSRLRHRLFTPAPDRLQHDPLEAWVRGPCAALAEVAAGQAPLAVAVSAMTPSLTAVDAGGVPVGPGVLYDDVRGRRSVPCADDPTASGEAAALLAWMAAEHPGAAGYWPAQAVANRALGGPGWIDYGSAVSAGALFDGTGWDEVTCAAAGVAPASLPGVAVFGAPIGEVAAGEGPPVRLGAGGVDAFCEQMVAGADAPGDVLIVCGSTMVVWATVAGWPRAAGLWTLPHLKGGMAVVGGPSNAGGLFVDWVDRLVAPTEAPPAASSVPVWWPYLRGERVPLHEPARRAAVAGLDITAGPAELRRAAREASAFAARHMIEVAGVDPARVVVSGGGSRDQQWMQALADTLGRDVEPVAVPEGAALGAAWLARMAAGLESSIDGAARWARRGRVVEPDPGWVGPTAERYDRYRRGIVEGGELRVR